MQPMLLHCADATGSQFAWRHELAWERANDLNLYRSVRRVRQDSGMIRLESGGSDCTMEAGFRENSVYSAYTLYSDGYAFLELRARLQPTSG